MNTFSIGKKLLLAFLLLSLVPLGILGFAAVHSASDGLRSQSYANLAAIAEYKTQTLDNWLEDRTHDVHLVPLTAFYQSAAIKLTGGTPEEKAQAQEAVLRGFRLNQQLHGYYSEMKLLDLQGNHLVSLMDIMENESQKHWFQGAVKQAEQTRRDGPCQDLYISSIEHCGELDRPSIHMAHVIRHPDTFVPLAMYVVDCNISQLQEIMADRVGMGETGESFLVGEDRIARSNLPLLPGETIFKQRLDTDGVGEVFRNKQGHRGAGYCSNSRYENHQGHAVLAHNHYNPLLNVAVITEITEAEAFAAVTALEWQIGIIALVASAIIVAIALLLARRIATPIQQTMQVLHEIELGHVEEPLQLTVTSNDEIGQMAQTLNAFAANLKQEVVATMQQLAAGDLTFDVCPKDERDVIRGSLQKMGTDLNGMMEQILSASEQIAAGSAQVSDSSQTLSQGATESASSLEQIAASMNELSAQTKLNADNASQANDLSEKSQQAADSGSHQMAQMVEAMTAVNDSSRNISKIIKVIDEIAFQTNLLALNAAVEAARAGQHGKGFAVVAEEVRNLAARSAKAASETAELIEDSVQKVAYGAEIAEQTADGLNDIISTIGKVTDLIGDIATASQEQAQGIEQINIGLGQIDQVTQQNTASAEEGAAASEELSSQAIQLRNLLSRFKVKSMHMQPSVASFPPHQN